ncbi:MAG TPA: DUF542 domain-containing protein, partial [Nevskiaceae bacterium]|nr:DUF542 domain-containing protein [Nevskiaceae bacterium]
MSIETRAAAEGGTAGRFGALALGDIATHLPGSTAVLRRYKLDFCCGGARSLAQAAAEKSLPLTSIEAELAALDAAAAVDHPTEPLALIDHILRRYHDVHRRELPELIRLATRVEAVHKNHPQVPRGLADALREAAGELEMHMQKEEQVLFPLMRAGGAPMIVHPIAQMRAEHDEHGERLRAIEQLTRNATPPDDACP